MSLNRGCIGLLRLVTVCGGTLLQDFQSCLEILTLVSMHFNLLSLSYAVITEHKVISVGKVSLQGRSGVRVSNRSASLELIVCSRVLLGAEKGRETAGPRLTFV